jgi:hypothetical protein
MDSWGQAGRLAERGHPHCHGSDDGGFVFVGMESTIGEQSNMLAFYLTIYNRKTDFEFKNNHQRAETLQRSLVPVRTLHNHVTHYLTTS